MGSEIEDCFRLNGKEKAALTRCLNRIDAGKSVFQTGGHPIKSSLRRWTDGEIVQRPHGLSLRGHAHIFTWP